MVTSFIRYLFKLIWFFPFQIKMKTKKKLQIWISLRSCHSENVKFIWYWFYFLWLYFNIETEIKTVPLISYLNLSKKRNGTLSTPWTYDVNGRASYCSVSLFWLWKLPVLPQFWVSHCFFTTETPSDYWLNWARLPSFQCNQISIKRLYCC